MGSPFSCPCLSATDDVDDLLDLRGPDGDIPLDGLIALRAQDAPLNERQGSVINRLLDGFEGKLTSSKYAKLTKCSQDTAHRDIQTLVERGFLFRTPKAGAARAIRWHPHNSGEDQTPSQSDPPEFIRFVIDVQYVTVLRLACRL